MPQKKEIKHPLKLKLTLGQKLADVVVSFVGNWVFISGLFIVIGVWIGLNVYLISGLDWDPYPFILLNLVLSCLAAIQVPIILMSQNREAQRDRLRMEYDYKVNVKAEREIEDAVVK